MSRNFSGFTLSTAGRHKIWLHMYVCMRACVCVCMYVCICMHACMYACVYVCMYVCVYVCGCLNYTWSDLLSLLAVHIDTPINQSAISLQCFDSCT